MIDIVEIMQKLSRERPIFHSEADFQHALAWQIHVESPESQIRLEYPLDYEESRHLDIVLLDGNRELAFELKYKKCHFLAFVQREIFSLRTDSAEDIGRYDFLKDVQRLEKFVSNRPNANGYAILLTNDSLYWRASPRETISDAFRVTEGRKITGMLSWSATAGKGTTKDRQSSITLHGTYDCSWRDYSEFEPTDYVLGDNRVSVPDSKFRYLLFTV